MSAFATLFRDNGAPSKLLLRLYGRAATSLPESFTRLAPPSNDAQQTDTVPEPPIGKSLDYHPEG
jgi:hypothetical protein